MVVLLAASCGTASPTAPAATSPASIAAYASAAIDIFQANSFYRDQIDWVSLRSQVAQAASAGKSKNDTMYLAISLVADNHSWYQPTAGSIVFPFPTAPCIEAAPVPPPLSVPADVGYVQVPAFSGSSAASVAFATNLQSQIQQQDRPDLVGWIVDLRQNGGGNMWPMLAGIGPILGDGLAGYFVDPRDVATPWGYTDGSSVVSTFPQTTVTTPYHLIAPLPKVAVLTDSRTNSSGEAIVVAFRNRASTRSFGGQTCGRSSGDHSYALSDGATLGVMTTIDADRNGVHFGGVIVPDETVADAAALSTRVVEWLHSSSTGAAVTESLLASSVGAEVTSPRFE